jgi:Family of unknown function (DUF6308)
LLAGRSQLFNKLLCLVPNIDLVDINHVEINESWPAWRLWDELRTPREVDWVITSKLLACKRPRLIPMYDRVVKTVTGGDRNFRVPLCQARCQALQADDQALHRRLLRLHREAGLPHEVSPLRVFDVIAWMEGQGKGH